MRTARGFGLASFLLQEFGKICRIESRELGSFPKRQGGRWAYRYGSKGANTMVTGELKNKIDGLWEIFWTGGITNPLSVIEQMTYLMFIHDLDEMDNRRAKEAAMLDIPHRSLFPAKVKIGDEEFEGNQFKWSVFHDFPAEKMYQTVQAGVFPFIKNLHGDKDSAYSQYMGDALFMVPTALMLDKIVTAMDGIYGEMAQLHDKDVRGDVYEYLLSKIATAGVNGQFRTPRHIIRMMVEMMAPTAEDVVCDKRSAYLIQSHERVQSPKSLDTWALGDSSFLAQAA